MILFTKENAAKIVAGDKDETRRYWLTQRMYPGNLYYCQTSLKPNTRFARIRCLDIWEWDGKTISHENAIAEGYAGADEFIDAYNHLNAKRFEEDFLNKRKHYAIKFEVVESYKDGVATKYYRQQYYIDKETMTIRMVKNNK